MPIPIKMTLADWEEFKEPLNYPDIDFQPIGRDSTTIDDFSDFRKNIQDVYFTDTSFLDEDGEWSMIGRLKNGIYFHLVATGNLDDFDSTGEVVVYGCQSLKHLFLFGVGDYIKALYRDFQEDQLREYHSAKKIQHWWKHLKHLGF